MLHGNAKKFCKTHASFTSSRVWAINSLLYFKYLSFQGKPLPNSPQSSYKELKVKNVQDVIAIADKTNRAQKC